MVKRKWRKWEESLFWHLDVRPIIAKNGLSIITSVLDLEYNSCLANLYSDAILVSIDSEGHGNGKGNGNGKFSPSSRCQGEFGVAILDTRDLAEPVPPNEAIATYNLVSSGFTQYHKQALRKYLFGKPMSVPKYDLVATFKSLIPEGRKVILVGHGFGREIQMLSLLGTDFKALGVIACLDTCKIGCQVYPGPDCFTFKALLKVLDIPGIYFHNADNDANFALRALLLLGITHLQMKERRFDGNVAQVLEEIARAPLPSEPPGMVAIRAEIEEARAAKKAAKEAAKEARMANEAKKADEARKAKEEKKANKAKEANNGLEKMSKKRILTEEELRVLRANRACERAIKELKRLAKSVLLDEEEEGTD